MRTVLCVALAGLLVGVLGCDQGGDGAAPAGSSAAASGAKKSSLTQQQLDDAYKLADPDHYDKSLAAVTGKLGPPQKTEPDAAIWYAPTKDGKGCYTLKLTKSKGHEAKTVDKSNCGL